MHYQKCPWAACDFMDGKTLNFTIQTRTWLWITLKFQLNVWRKWFYLEFLQTPSSFLFNTIAFSNSCIYKMHVAASKTELNIVLLKEVTDSIKLKSCLRWHPGVCETLGAAAEVKVTRAPPASCVCLYQQPAGCSPRVCLSVCQQLGRLGSTGQSVWAQLLGKLMRYKYIYAKSKNIFVHIDIYLYK